VTPLKGGEDRLADRMRVRLGLFQTLGLSAYLGGFVSSSAFLKSAVSIRGECESRANREQHDWPGIRILIPRNLSATWRKGFLGEKVHAPEKGLPHFI
jgi:hypothetical protein